MSHSSLIVNHSEESQVSKSWHWLWSCSQVSKNPRCLQLSRIALCRSRFCFCFLGRLTGIRNMQHPTSYQSLRSQKWRFDDRFIRVASRSGLKGESMRGDCEPAPEWDDWFCRLRWLVNIVGEAPERDKSSPLRIESRRPSTRWRESLGLRGTKMRKVMVAWTAWDEKQQMMMLISSDDHDYLIDSRLEKRQRLEVEMREIKIYQTQGCPSSSTGRPPKPFDWSFVIQSHRCLGSDTE